MACPQLAIANDIEIRQSNCTHEDLVEELSCANPVKQSCHVMCQSRPLLRKNSIRHRERNLPSLRPSSCPRQLPICTALSPWAKHTLTRMSQVLLKPQRHIKYIGEEIPPRAKRKKAGRDTSPPPSTIGRPPPTAWAVGLSPSYRRQDDMRVTSFYNSPGVVI
jgi:hypothetical protein